MFEKHRGFILYEAVISVGIIAISSIFILQVFYRAGSLSNRANDIDVANSILAQAIEVSKNAKSSSDFFNDEEIFGHKVLEPSEEENMLYTVSVYYDKDWNILEKKTETIPEMAEFIATYGLIEEINYEENIIKNFTIGASSDEYLYGVNTIEAKGVLYTIVGTMTVLKEPLFVSSESELSSPVLTSLSGSKYIVNAEY